MKVKFSKIAIFILPFCFNPLMAQVKTQVGETITYSSKLLLRTELETGTNGLNQYFINRLVFGGYISPAEVNSANNRLKENSRAGFYNDISIKYFLENKAKTKDSVLQKKQRIKYLSLGQSQIAGTEFTKQGFELFFRGNVNYLGKKLSLDGTDVMQLNARTVKFGILNLTTIAKGRLNINLEVGLSQLLTYRNLNIKNGFVYTDTNAAYADLMLNGQFQNSGLNNGLGKGVGLVFGLEFNKEKGSRAIPFNFGIRNVGAYYIPKLTKYSVEMDQAARLDQLDISASSLKTSSWLQLQKDTAKSSLNIDTSEVSKWVISPFYAFIRYRMHGIDLLVDYRYISGFIPRLTIAPIQGFKWIKQTEFKPSLELGGFDNFNVNLTIAKNIIRKNNLLGIQFWLNGLEALAFPKKQHGAGAGIRVNISTN